MASVKTISARPDAPLRRRSLVPGLAASLAASLIVVFASAAAIQAAGTAPAGDAAARTLHAHQALAAAPLG